jgi:hypothetical protein
MGSLSSTGCALIAKGSLETAAPGDGSSSGTVRSLPRHALRRSVSGRCRQGSGFADAGQRKCIAGVPRRQSRVTYCSIRRCTAPAENPADPSSELSATQCRENGVRVNLTAVDPGFRLGGRPFGSGATRRLSALTIESLDDQEPWRSRALAICRLKRASPSAHPPFVAACGASAKSASPTVRNSSRYAF